MKRLCSILTPSLLMISIFSAAAENIYDKLIIQAIPSSEGTVVLEGKPKYEKTFKIVVFSEVRAPINLTGFVGCYKAYDDKGKSFDERLVQSTLLGTLKAGSVKEGEVSFISDDKSVYNAEFVKWSSQCPHLKNIR